MGGFPQRLLAVLLLAVWATPTASFALVGLHVLLGTHQGHHSVTSDFHGHEHPAHSHDGDPEADRDTQVAVTQHRESHGGEGHRGEGHRGEGHRGEGHRHDPPGHSHGPEGHPHGSASHSHGPHHQAPADGARGTDCHAADHDLSGLAEALAHGHRHPPSEAAPEHEDRLVKRSRILAFSGSLLAAPQSSTDRVPGIRPEGGRGPLDPTGREPTVPLFTLKCALLL